MVTVDEVSPVVLLNAAEGMGARCNPDASLEATATVDGNTNMVQPRTVKVAIATAATLRRTTVGSTCSTRMSGMEVLSRVQPSEYYIQSAGQVPFSGSVSQRARKSEPRVGTEGPAPDAAISVSARKRG
jgi:hypothetical protein